jgi:hypothetical protein
MIQEKKEKLQKIGILLTYTHIIKYEGKWERTVRKNESEKDIDLDQ